MATREVEWVLLRTYSDAVEAELVANFLREHGVSALIRGNNVSTALLNNVSPFTEARIMVPRGEAESAIAALDALASDARHAYRDLPADMPDGDDDPPEVDPRGAADRADVPPDRARSVSVPLVLAPLVPLGSGHLYAGHYGAGLTLALAIVGNALFYLTAAPTVTGAAWHLHAIALIVAGDAVCGRAAVLRYNDGRVPPAGRQAIAAAFFVVIAMLVARAFGG